MPRKSYTVSYLRHKLADVLEYVSTTGEEIVVTSGRNGEPLAKIVAIRNTRTEPEPQPAVGTLPASGYHVATCGVCGSFCTCAVDDSE